MRFFSKIVFICNCCFIAAVILRFVENANKKKGNFDGNIILQPLESTLVVLGYGAIFINLVFNLFVLVMLSQKKSDFKISKWLIWTSFIFFIIQIYYFFFSNY